MHGVCLPGRESRFVEPFIVDDWKSLLKDFCKDVYGILKEKPFAFWGHRFVLYLSMKRVYGGGGGGGGVLGNDVRY